MPLDDTFLDDAAIVPNGVPLIEAPRSLRVAADRVREIRDCRAVAELDYRKAIQAALQPDGTSSSAVQQINAKVSIVEAIDRNLGVARNELEAARAAWLPAFRALVAPALQSAAAELDRAASLVEAARRTATGIDRIAAEFGLDIRRFAAGLTSAEDLRRAARSMR